MGKGEKVGRGEVGVGETGPSDCHSKEGGDHNFVLQKLVLLLFVLFF